MWLSSLFSKVTEPDNSLNETVAELLKKGEVLIKENDQMLKNCEKIRLEGLEKAARAKLGIEKGGDFKLLERHNSGVSGDYGDNGGASGGYDDVEKGAVYDFLDGVKDDAHAYIMDEVLKPMVHALLDYGLQISTIAYVCYLCYQCFRIIYFGGKAKSAVVQAGFSSFIYLCVRVIWKAAFKI